MSRVPKKSDACLNCKTPLRPEDNYCPICGQLNNTHKIPVKHLVLELFEDLFHFDTKLWNTLKVSFTRPGKITLDYLEGKRASYVPPIKFYIFVSFIFFLLLGKLSDHAVDSGNKLIGNGMDLGSMNLTINELQGNKRLHHSQGPNDVRMISFDFKSADSLRTELTHLKHASDIEIDKLLRGEDIDTTIKNRERLRNAIQLIPVQIMVLDSAKPSYCIFGNVRFKTKEEYGKFKENIHNYSDEQVDSLLIAKGEKASWMNSQLVKKLGRFDWNNKDDMKSIVHAIIKSISLTMFIMMPVTAILLLLIFYSKKYYYEHLIFSIHIHTIFFIIFSLVLAVQVFISDRFGGELWPWAFLLCLVYLVASLKHNYKQTWGKTIAKFFLMSIPYFIVSLTLTLVAVLYGFLA